jgi:hypothetical protein
METISKLYIGYLGWSTSTLHAVRVDELEDGSGYRTEPYAICKPNTFRHYRIGLVNRIRRTQATAENVTCKDCIRRLQA